MRTWIVGTSDTQQLPVASPKSKRVRSSESGVRSQDTKLTLQSSIFNPPSSIRNPPAPSVGGQSTIRNGFTLLELSVVLFIIGLLFTVTLPRLSSFSGGQAQASARRLSALVRYVSNEAAVSGRPYRLHYDLDQRAYWVTVLTATPEGGEFLRDESPLSRRVQLPSTVAFVDVFIPGSGRVQSGQVYTHFYPQGYADPTIIHLRDHYAQITTVTIPPFTGEAWITDGYTDGFLPRR